MNTVNEKLIKLPKIKYIIIVAIILQVLSCTINLLFVLFSANIGGDLTSKLETSIIDTIIGVVIYAPIIETLILQTLIFKLLGVFKIKTWIKIIISAFCFSLAHLSYSIFYSINTFIVGIILAYSFAIYKDKDDKPTQTVMSIHSLANAITITLNIILLNF